MSKCIGCGAVLQQADANSVGYTRKIGSQLCERCFRIKHYNDYKLVVKDNNDFINILQRVGQTDSLVLLVVDLLNIPKVLNDLNKYLHNKILLVLTKRDLLPLSVYDDKLINYFKNYHLNIIDSVIISSSKNYHFDLLLEKIYKYQTNSYVYVVGFTNAGKSTMINKIIYNYGSQEPFITTSMLPSTTIDSIEIKLNDRLSLVDTPGLLDKNSFINIIDAVTLKKITPLKEIKPKTYQIKAKQSIMIEDFFRIDCEHTNSLTFYVANSLSIIRDFKVNNKLNDLEHHIIKVEENSDIVINGLGFIKIVNSDCFNIYVPKGVDVYTRHALI